MSVALAFGAAAAAAAIVVAAVRSWARRRDWLDVPNDRSSHARPTPTSGGIGIVLPLIPALALAPSLVSRGAAVASATAVGLVATIGFLDDRRTLAPRTRLVAHTLAGVVVAGTTALEVRPHGSAAEAALIVAAWTFVTIASINVVNFMDGIDGLIGVTALTFALFSAVALSSRTEAWAAFALAGAAFGFLLFNRPPATIFMGDVGSGALGATFVLLGLWTMGARGWSVAHAFLPLGPLVVDEVLTMARRIARRENLAQAHRSHVYQVLANSGWGHGPVAAAYAIASAGLAALSLFGPARPGPFFVVATAAMLALAVLMLLTRARAERAGERPPARATREGFEP